MWRRAVLLAGIAALPVLVFVAPAAAVTITVTSPNPSGANTLNQAIQTANTTAGADDIHFAIGIAGTSQSITQSSALPLIIHPVTIDGSTQAPLSPDPPININGAGTSSSTDGLVFAAGADGSTLRGVALNQFGRDGVVIAASGVQVFGSVIGGDRTATTDLGNGDDGIAVSGALAVVADDFVVGNQSQGVRIGSGADGTTVSGSDIGTNGTDDLGNGADGVALGTAHGVTVGVVAGQPFLGGHLGNLIAGNGLNGVEIFGSAQASVVSGNQIGTDDLGDSAIPNGGPGVLVDQADGTRIQPASPFGTPIPNLIAGNGGAGVLVDSGGTNTTIDANQIGTDGSPANTGDGIDLHSTGGRVTNNVVDHNALAGVHIDLPSASGNVVTGNLIGLSTANSGAGNGGEGVRIDGSAASNTIGGTAGGAGNTVSDNGKRGILVQGAGGGNVIQGNTVGTNVAGTLIRGNAGDGIKADNSNTTTIGGTAPGAGNLVAGNQGAGIGLESASGLVVQGNTVGLNRAATSPLPNDLGIEVFSLGTTIGGSAPGAGNLVSGNSGAGIDAARDPRIQGNTIGLGAGGRPVPNGGDGVHVRQPGTVIGGAGGAANTIAANAGAGVGVEAGKTATVAENAIFDNDGLGIDFAPAGVTAAGAPAIASAVFGGNGPTTAVTGTLDAAPNQVFTLRFFAGPGCDPSGFGEGRTPLGSAAAATDGAGHAGFSATIGATPNDVVTATATSAAGATSEFSNCRAVVGARGPATTTTTTTTATTTTATQPTVAPPPAPVAPVCTLSLGGNAGGLSASVGCDRAATVTVSGSATIAKRNRKARKAAAKAVALAPRTVSVAAGQRAKVKLPLPRTVLAAVKRHGRVSVAIVADARTADGARATKTATISRLRAVKRKRRK